MILYMKKLLLMGLLFMNTLFIFSQKHTYNFQNLIIQKGEKAIVPLNGIDGAYYSADKLGTCIIFDQYEYYGTSSYGKKANLFGVERGQGIFDSKKLNDHLIYNVRVVDVVKIDIPENIKLIENESYAYSPIITDAEATTTLTWMSSNPTVATIDVSGNLTAIGKGQATITCTAANGVKAQSVVTVSPLLLGDIVLDKQTHEMGVGDNVQLATTYSPANATTKAVKWMSGNDNVAQVDNDGNVTAVAPGYCSIYAIAKDGSGQFDKCLIHVIGTGYVKGDINGDGGVTPQDASMILQYVAKKITW